MTTLQSLRARAIAQTLFTPATLKKAADRLGFIQADPIRSPARAQDLILRLRVKNYRVGDLERLYASLDIEEDYLYAYGFVHRRVWQILHPRGSSRLSDLERKVLDAVRRDGETHPAALEAHFGRARVINDWGGYSKATTRALEALHYRGLLRIARREDGIRVYAPAEISIGLLAPEERMRRLVLAMVDILAPVPIRTLHANIARYRSLANPRAALHDLLREGVLRRDTVDGLDYIEPPERRLPRELPPVVRFMAPFDPVVWDRLRFEHLWGWPYRFEAYTPAARRVRGYYAMPLLWRDDVIGWANANVVGGELQVDVGFAKKRPADREFLQALDDEIARLDAFLTVRDRRR